MAEIQTYYYQDGNTARQILEPQQDWERIRREREEEEKRRRQHKKRIQAKRQRRNRMYTMYLSFAVASVCAFFVGYVYLQSSITTSMKNISSLETEIASLKADNSAAKNRINTTANLQAVKDVAVNDLGMVYAKSDQIVYYDMEQNDSMKQYEDIP